MPQRFQVVTLRVPFNPPAQQAPSTWAWENLPIHATLLDADPVSEDPDVQPITRLPDEPLAHVGAPDDAIITDALGVEYTVAEHNAIVDEGNR